MQMPRRLLTLYRLPSLEIEVNRDYVSFVKDDIRAAIMMYSLLFEKKVVIDDRRYDFLSGAKSFLNRYNISSLGEYFYEEKVLVLIDRKVYVIRKEVSSMEEEITYFYEEEETNKSRDLTTLTDFISDDLKRVNIVIHIPRTRELYVFSVDSYSIQGREFKVRIKLEPVCNQMERFLAMLAFRSKINGFIVDNNLNILGMDYDYDKIVIKLLNKNSNSIEVYRGDIFILFDTESGRYTKAFYVSIVLKNVSVNDLPQEYVKVFILAVGNINDLYYEYRKMGFKDHFKSSVLYRELQVINQNEDYIIFLEVL